MRTLVPVLAGLFAASFGPASGPVWADPARVTRTVLLDSGSVYFQNCGFCHGPEGKGDARGPTLANSDYVQGNRVRLIRTVLEGITDTIRVNGVRWRSGEMTGWAGVYSDFKIAAVLTWIRAVLNDSAVVSCVPEDIETGTWASCKKTPRAAADVAADSISVEEVAAVRAALSASKAH